jgi:PIN domain nuclease of toxin-antitoxin system
MPARLLLDSHVYLWLLDGDRRLSAAVRKLILDHATEAFLSMASLWELAIKVSLGKLDPLYLGNGDPLANIKRTGLKLLEINMRHVTAVERLPLRHRDAFDRMLIAQAQSNGLEIVSRDAVFAQYEGLRVRAP